MSAAAANTLSGSVPKTPNKRVSGWAQLTRLYPYVARHKTEVFIGLITQIGMGITGTLLPLIIGAIVDCIKGAEAPLAQLGRLTQISLGFLLPYYHPRSGHTLAIFCSALILICALQGVFSYSTRQILIGCRATSSTTSQRPAGEAGPDGAGILRAEPDGRADVALHE